MPVWLAKLQIEVCRLQESLESKHLTRMESSKSTLQDARSIQLIQNRLHGGQQLSLDDRDGSTKVIESLVNDNEVLKQDNGGL
jgi:hypothetical protein